MNYLLSFLTLLCLFLATMVYDEYLGTLAAVLLGVICLAVWIISYVVEFIEPSRVRPAYYRYLLTGFLAPALALVLYLALRGQIEWMTP